MFTFQLFNFLSKKCEKSFLMRRNPRKISWTVLYRKKHRKGTQEEVTKKRTRRNVKFQRAIQGASLEAILAKKNMKPEVREAQRNQAIKLVKSFFTYYVRVSAKSGKYHRILF